MFHQFSSPLVPSGLLHSASTLEKGIFSPALRRLLGAGHEDLSWGTAVSHGVYWCTMVYLIIEVKEFVIINTPNCDIGRGVIQSLDLKQNHP